MADIQVQNLTKRFGSHAAVDNVSLTVDDQEFVVLLGPSGCGKTTLLRAIAGLGMADEGVVCIGGRDVTYLPPRDRQISMVFQSYAIFPHMNVYDNIAFGLKMNRHAPKVIRDRVNRAAELLHIENLLDRFPNKMSGGQRQRVAVARAIAMQAQVLLMDEPLSNLDALLREIKATTMYVTHDQIEALSMGDRIAVMKNGVIQQYDRPSTVYDLPANQFVGSFIGNPPMNFLSGHVQQQDGTLRVKVGEHVLAPSPEMQPLLRGYAGRQVRLGIRAENMETFDEPQRDALPVRVLVVEPLGSQNLLTVKIGDDTVKVATHPTFAATVDANVWVRFPADKIRWVDRDSGVCLYP